MVLSSVACADALERTTLSPHEYAAYRRTRLADTVEGRLAAGGDYLGRYPRGAYRAEVEAWFGREGPRYVQQAWNDLPHLRAFVAAVPKGASADRARGRIQELSLTAEFRETREREQDARARSIETRLASADVARRRFVAGLVAWTRRVASIRSWGGRTSELDPDFLALYRLDPPGARCTNDGCTKTISVGYAVPEGKVQSAREASYSVKLRLEKGGVMAAWITGPALFTRLGEAVRLAAVSPKDWVGRAEAIGQAVQVLALAVEPALPASRCTADPVSPVVLRRVCNGVDLRVVSALSDAEEDQIVIEPTQGDAGPSGASPR
jgi:hypothetical protein